MTKEKFNYYLAKLEANDPSMNWVMANLAALDFYISIFGDDINFIKKVCNEILYTLELADMDYSLLEEFLDKKGYGVKFEEIKPFTKTK